MIVNKKEIALLKQNQILQEDCRTYKKKEVRLTETLLRLIKMAEEAIEIDRSWFGTGLLIGLISGLAMAHTLFYLAGRL